MSGPNGASLKVSGFEWDNGNLAKCQKHGVSVREIESLFAHSLRVRPDIVHSHSEERFQAIGKGGGDRFIFLVFTIRMREGEHYIRPISARYMHREEIEGYEEDNPEVPNR